MIDKEHLCFKRNQKTQIYNLLYFFEDCKQTESHLHLTTKGNLWGKKIRLYHKIEKVECKIQIVIIFIKHIAMVSFINRMHILHKFKIKQKLSLLSSRWVGYMDQMTPQCSIVNHAYRQIIDLQILLYYFSLVFLVSC